MDLRCRKTNCKFNKDLTCLAKSISISNKLECNEYKYNNSKEMKDFSKLIFSENPPKIADYRHIKNMNLSCKAKCLFNCSNKCIANGITISAPNQTAKCMTFLKP